MHSCYLMASSLINLPTHPYRHKNVHNAPSHCSWQVDENTSGVLIGDDMCLTFQYFMRWSFQQCHPKLATVFIPTFDGCFNNTVTTTGSTT
jgi:hypothetical protein